MTLLLFAWGCGSSTGSPSESSPPGDSAVDSDPVSCTEVPVTLTVSGEVGASDAAVAAILDASTWRMGDAGPLTRELARDQGVFTLCLSAPAGSARPWELALWAAWIDLDGDGRLDAASEPLCDTTDGAKLADPLYFQDGAWRAGWEGTPGGPLVGTLDGDHCTR